MGHEVSLGHLVDGPVFQRLVWDMGTIPSMGGTLLGWMGTCGTLWDTRTVWNWDGIV